MLIYVKFYRNYQDFINEETPIEEVVGLDNIIGISIVEEMMLEQDSLFKFRLQTRDSKLLNTPSHRQVESYTDFPIFAKTRAGAQAKQFNLVSEINSLKVLHERSLRGVNELACSYSVVTNSGFKLKTLDLSMNMAYVLDLTKKIE